MYLKISLIVKKAPLRSTKKQNKYNNLIKLERDISVRMHFIKLDTFQVRKCYRCLPAVLQEKDEKKL